MKRIIILILCVGILLPCSFTVSAQTDDPWVNLIGGTVQAGIAIGQKFKAAKNEKKIEEMRRKGDPHADCYFIAPNGSLDYDLQCGRMVDSILAANKQEEARIAEQQRIEQEQKRVENEKAWEATIKYVDLGLPSGTLWGNLDMIGHYDYDNAVRKFGSKLPTKEQMEELLRYCTISHRTEFVTTDIQYTAFDIIGPNGQMIFTIPQGYWKGEEWSGEFQEEDWVARWWSSTPLTSEQAYHLSFAPNQTNIVEFPRNYCLSIRFVQNNPSKHTNYNQYGDNSVRSGQSESSKYVDLGLPSGTLWKDSNEGGDHVHYTYDEAISQFGNKLPSKQQLEELKDKCTWIRKDNECIVVGPNGNSITLPAAGHRYCGGRVADVGEAQYWSSTPYDSDHAWSLYCMSSGFNRMFGEPYCYGLSVRLVQ